MSSQSSSSAFIIVQDGLLGAYLLTKNNLKINKERFYDLAIRCEFTDNTTWNSQYILKKLSHIRKVLKNKGKKAQAFNGRGLLSLLLPEGFIYHQPTNDSDYILDIYDGVILDGYMDKKSLGKSSNSIIQLLHKEYSPKVASKFIDNIQFVTNGWLFNEGFSIGLEDCLVTKEEEIKNIITTSLFKAESIKKTTDIPGIREMKINAALSNARDNGLKIARDSLKSTNNFISTVKSGSKGDFFNIAQITGILGQQNLSGKRLEYRLCHGKKALPHYSENLTINEEYESKGFISKSFMKGLSPKEFFAHAMVGREGITNTALGTAKSGYIQRKISALSESLTVRYNGMVTNTVGTVFQSIYSGDGFSRAELVKVKGELQPVNIYRLADKLNLKYSK